MYLEKTIAVVVPAYNEEKLIARALESIPDLVDKIIVVNDASRDNTGNIVRDEAKKNSKIYLIEHEVNQGVGGAIVTGYKTARDMNIDVTVVMAGDAQMDPKDFIPVIEPIATGTADYTKGNRLFHGDAWQMIPHYRYLGNSFLSLMTKIASGYWHIADSQSGYTAISLLALKKLNLDKIYKRYGMPNDILIMLNELNFRVRDVHIRPVYNIGEKSGIRLMKVIPKISLILFKGFWHRLLYKYVIKDFHPLIFFYLLSIFLLGASVLLSIRLFYFWIILGHVPAITAMALVFSVISGLQTLFFGMWFDMEYNKDLR
ncbi:Glycosyltransferase involved in cell wall biogenesis [uncultured Desulfobacterium sp.]|uniref:Glycosyltransferase involved in cell wall biogenesis n=1 Tax=uncultured Desulfobacterium sp. TaxID=201089 RepID=A0A445MWY0_9BACT|nr:Glycosyltransferase involved in cell wall biogenesis [uncultured Desulfobacterium sp.]